ncbi:MAG: NAD(P)-dependent oxidoreductase [Pirellulaceae bacterium]|jgi:3-hydroxyisobutyrate dehydrogenase-like beta-hydroxyacid dehydrogenase|nr:NAD(P)-dependent oxidoreductase [Pirellulaceae bacterium]
MTKQNPVQKIGVIGLGLMGTAITVRLIENGFVPVVWNRTRAKADALIDAGAQWSDRPLAECQRVIISLFSSDVVREVLTPMLVDLRTGQTLIDTTTGDPRDSIHWEQRLKFSGAFYLDAPISGSSQQTREGRATVMVGGQQRAFEDCNDLWPVLGAQIFHVGPCGSAAKMKLVSNLILGLNRAALAEGLAFADALHIDLHTALAVLRGSAAYSRQMDTKGTKMIDGDFAVHAKLTQHLKDVNLILETAEQEGLVLPISQAHRRLLQQAEALGYGQQDNSAIIQALRRSPA